MIAVIQDSGLIDKYLARVKAGLKGFDEERQQEIVAEIRSHLIDRAEQMKQQGTVRATEEAISAMGAPQLIAAQFLEADIVRASAKSNFP